MKPYNNNILVIDDKVEELTDEIITPLKRMNFNVEKQSNPQSGLQIASHYYSVIFIDFQFDNSTELDGTKLCKKIRKRYPLSTLILLTAFGKENIQNFAHAPWDGYFEKDEPGTRPSELDIRLLERLNEAVKERFENVPFLKNIPNELAKINKATYILNKLQDLFNTKAEAKIWSDEAIATELEFNNRAALAQKFTQQNSETNEIKKDALIFRHIIMSNPPSEWNLAKEYYNPLKKLVDYFRI